MATSIGSRLVLTSLAVALAVIVLRIIERRYRQRRLRRLQGCEEPVSFPHADWLWGSDLLALRKQALKDGRLQRLYVDQHRALGETWQEIADGSVKINTISKLNMQQIYVAQQTTFAKTSASNAASNLLFGRGILLANGEEWKWNRSIVAPTFAKYETRLTPTLENHVKYFIAQLPRDGEAFDIQPSIKRLFLDIATGFLFGDPIGAQSEGEGKEADVFLETLDSALLGLNKRRQGFNLTSVKLWFDKSYATDVAKVHAFIDTYIHRAIARSGPAQDGDKEFEESSNTLLDQMVKKTRDVTYLRGALLQCFLPGRDQTAILLANTLFELARHPEHWGQLRATALSLSEDQTSSFQTLSTLTPIRNAILEALRLRGPAGGNARITTRNTTLPEGGGPSGQSPIFLPKGTKVVTHMVALHRNRAYWGEDADEYRPGRFEELRPQWEFRPFLAGPRTCPAKAQAMVQVTYVLVRLLREFEGIENRDEVAEFVEISRLATESRRGVRIALKPPAKEAF